MDQEGFVRELEGAYQAMGKMVFYCKWYNNCEGIGLVYQNIDPYARKEQITKCT